MKAVPDSKKHTVAREDGIYLSVGGVADTPSGLVCSYRRGDSHTATWTDIMVAYSADGGRTWTGHHPIAHASCARDGAVWVAPELNRLRDGRLVLICDRGRRAPGQSWPSLYDWQQPARGMANYLFWSHDDGRTWQAPVQIDDVGGEPERVHELANGWLVFTRTEAADRPDVVRTPAMVRSMPPPWAYYRNVAVASKDRGATWERLGVVSDDPRYSDCEVGLVEVAPGRLLAVTRAGNTGGSLGHPSRFIWSEDSGQTWSRPVLAPIYGQRPIPGLLQSGRILVTFRQAFGTPGTYALVFDPGETFPYHPTVFVWDESRLRLEDGALTIRTAEGSDDAAEVRCFPAQDARARVRLDATLRVVEADVNGCVLRAGCAVRVTPGRLCLADRPAVGLDLDATQWHDYTVMRDGGVVRVLVDGHEAICSPLDGLAERLVGFGNRSVGAAPRYERNAGVSQWRAVRVDVQNPEDHTVGWSWHATQGYPDRFRRARVVALDRNRSRRPAHLSDADLRRGASLAPSAQRAFFAGDSGYSGWTQRADGTIVIVDYTCGEEPAERPFIRSYVVREDDLT